jgi:hypothetical protein
MQRRILDDRGTLRRCKRRGPRDKDPKTTSARWVGVSYFMWREGHGEFTHAPAVTSSDYVEQRYQQSVGRPKPNARERSGNYSCSMRGEGRLLVVGHGSKAEAWSA